ncbi:MAG: YlbF family regulator [Clostridia bacterium]|nr:YlbF family regulator [Clostridia bacterium]
MNKEILKACAELAKAIGADDRMKRLDLAKAAYETDSAIKNLMAEYNVQQIALSEEYKKETRDEEFIGIINKRISELYTLISENPVMVEYMDANEAVNALMNEVNSEIQFFLTGERPCSHDCSSCSSNCASKNNDN